MGTIQSNTGAASPAPETIRQFELEEWKRRCSQTTMPAKYLPKNVYTDKTANGLTKLIIAYCRYMGWHAERINTQGRVIDNRREVTNILGHRRIIGSVKRIPTAGVKGSADIHILKDGKAVYVEVKIGRDRQSDAQKQYQRTVEAAGGLYVIVRCFADFIEQVVKGGEDER